MGGGGGRATPEFRLFTFWDLNKISNDRKSKRLFSSVDFRTSSQSIHHSEINTSLSTLTQNLEVKNGIMKMCTKC